jgi:hypothetical protein
MSLALQCRHVCVGPSQQSGALEWELRSGAYWLIDSTTPLDYPTLTQETDEGDPTGRSCPRFPSFANPPGPPEPLSTNIPSERPYFLEHPPQGQVHRKTGAPTSFGAAAFTFEWIASGFTAVCFWTAPWRRIAASVALEGPLRFGLCPGLHTGPTESE